MNKKGNFNILNTALISFVSFVLVSLMVIFILSTLKNTALVCGGEPTNASLTLYNGVCYRCAANDTTGNLSFYNSTGAGCYDTTSLTPYASSLLSEYSGATYNGTKQLMQASLLPPQFASIIVIVLIIVGILSLLALIGYNVYQKMKQ